MLKSSSEFSKTNHPPRPSHHYRFTGKEPIDQLIRMGFIDLLTMEWDINQAKARYEMAKCHWLAKETLHQFFNHTHNYLHHLTLLSHVLNQHFVQVG